MEKVLIAVDETKGSKNVLGIFNNLVRPPKEVLLLHVQRLEGRSLMLDTLSESELSTLKESLEGTEHKEKLDMHADKVLAYYRKKFESAGLVSVRTMKRAGIPADEILKAAEEEKVDLIVVGNNGKKGLHKLITGSVSAQVERNAAVQVLVRKAEAGAGVHEVEEAVSTHSG